MRDEHQPSLTPFTCSGSSAQTASSLAGLGRIAHPTPFASVSSGAPILSSVWPPSGAPSTQNTKASETPKKPPLQIGENLSQLGFVCSHRIAATKGVHARCRRRSQHSCSQRTQRSGMDARPRPIELICWLYSLWLHKGWDGSLWPNELFGTDVLHGSRYAKDGESDDNHRCRLVFVLWVPNRHLLAWAFTPLVLAFLVFLVLISA